MLLEFFLAVGVLVGLTISATELITSRIPAITGIWSQVVSWVVAGLLIFFAQFFDIEAIQWFVSQELWVKGLGTLAVGLISNGIFDIKLIQELLALIKFRSA